MGSLAQPRFETAAPTVDGALDTMGAETLLESTLDTMPGGLFTVDPRGRITSWNRAMEQLTGYAASEVLGMPCSRLAGDSCLGGPRGMGMGRCHLFAGEPIRGRRCTLVHRDGTVLPVHKNARLLHSAGGELLGGIEVVTDIRRLLELESELVRLRRGQGDRSFHGLVGAHPAMRRLYDMVGTAARTASPVLILGETGTGKELVAHAIHHESDRKDGPFIRVSCAALSESLLEGELFGHGPGASTGAATTRRGRFEAASGGTLFLDEIGDVSPQVQKKLLRVLQDCEAEGAGDSPIRVDTRVIAATHVDLQRLCDEERLRRDCTDRLALISVTIPPLRERLSDIPLLVDHFLRVHEVQERVRGLSPAAMERLMRHPWTGNVRELAHALEYALAVCDCERIDVEHLPPQLQKGREDARSPVGPQRRPSRETVEQVLRESRGVRAEAARRLGVSRVTLWKWLRMFEDSA
ncbi:MAG: hypothetical protein AMXMBFR64_41300 [Myxococcales bacterium]